MFRERERDRDRERERERQKTNRAQCEYCPRIFSFTDVCLRVQQPYRTADENDFPPERYSADDVLSSKNIYASGAEANGNPGGYASDSNHDYGGVLYTTNPYKKIPPIPTSSEGIAAQFSAMVHDRMICLFEFYLGDKKMSYMS